MLTIPLQTTPTDYVLLVIFEDENIQRLKAHDPGEVVMEKLGQPWQNLRMVSIQFIYATPKEVLRLTSLKHRSELVRYVKVLCRGWRFKPELGDNDSNYQRPAEN